MPEPIALCLEDLDAARRGARYTTCVAVRGDQSGLAVALDGKIAWRLADPVACELWVSADEQLILLRPEGAPPVQVSRAGRCLQAPFSKPVVLLDQDCIETAGRKLRVHVHGTAPAVAAPAPLPERSSSSRLAATLALGISALSCQKSDGGTKPVEVRETPPAPMALPLDAEVQTQDAGQDGSADAGDGDSGDAGRLDAKPEAAKPQQQPIEVRPHPPKPMRRD
jgi:hypothetical protein